MFSQKSQMGRVDLMFELRQQILLISLSIRFMWIKVYIVYTLFVLMYIDMFHVREYHIFLHTA